MPGLLTDLNIHLYSILKSTWSIPRTWLSSSNLKLANFLISISKFTSIYLVLGCNNFFKFIGRRSFTNYYTYTRYFLKNYFSKSKITISWIQFTHLIALMNGTEFTKYQRSFGSQFREIQGIRKKNFKIAWNEKWKKIRRFSCK